METKKPTLSWSKIHKAKCLLRYKHHYIDKDIQDEQTDPMKVGALVHDIIFAYSQACIDQHVDGDYELLTELVDNMFKESELDLEYYKQVRGSVIRFAERSFRFEYMKDFEREGTAEIGVDSKGMPILIAYKIDRTDVEETPSGPCLFTIDYKNQLNLLSETEVADHEQLQLYDYLNCYHIHPNYAIHQRGIYFIRWGSLRWAGEYRTLGEDTEYFDNIEAWLRMQWERIIYATKYYPTPGKYCFDPCPVFTAGKCPIWSKEQVEAYRTGHELIEKVRYLRRLDHMRKQAYDEVKALAPDEETVEVDGTEVGYTVSESYNYGFDELLKWCKKNGVSLSDMGLSKYAVEKTVKRQLDTHYLPESIEGIRNETRTKKFVF